MMQRVAVHPPGDDIYLFNNLKSFMYFEAKFAKSQPQDLVWVHICLLFRFSFSSKVFNLSKLLHVLTRVTLYF